MSSPNAGFAIVPVLCYLHPYLLGTYKEKERVKHFIQTTWRSPAVACPAAALDMTHRLLMARDDSEATEV